MIHVLIILISVLLSSSAWATAYYVTKSGSNANDGLSAGTAFLTIQKAADTVVAGDTVYVRAGTYNEIVTIVKAGTSGLPIAFYQYPGDARPIIDGNGFANTLDSVGIGSPSAYVTFSGFEVYRTPRHGIIVYDAHHITVTNNLVHDGPRNGVYLYNTSSSTVSYNTIYRMILAGNSDCIAASDGSVNNIIHHNAVARCSDDGIDTWTTTGNTVENNTSCLNGYDLNGIPAGDGNGFKLGSGGGNSVKNNIACNNLAKGFSANGGPNNMLSNNIAWGNGSVSYEAGLILVQKNLTVDPLILSLDPASSNFLTIAASSPAVNAGIVTPYTTNDGCGVDIGAFELP